MILSIVKDVAIKLRLIDMKIIVMKKIITLAILSLFTLHSHAGIRQYRADIENSTWQLTDDSRLQCTLSHQIPRYGEAKFYSSANRKMNMEFELQMMRLPDSYSLAEVRSEAPNWRPGVAGRVLADMKLHKQFSPSLPKKIAWNMLRKSALGYKFRRQHVIESFIVDFICLEKKLIVEVDGAIHKNQQEADAILDRVKEGSQKARPKVLFDVGEVVRVIDGPFNDFNGVVEEVNYEKSRLRVAVLIFGRSTPVELEFAQVEKE